MYIMYSMKTLSTTELRENISHVLDAVTHRNQIVGIGRRSKVEAVIFKWPAYENNAFDDVTNMNANSSSFDFLAEEPDLYTIDDLRKRYV